MALFTKGLNHSKTAEPTREELARALTEVCGALDVEGNAQTAHALLGAVEGNWTQRIQRAAERLALSVTTFEGDASRVPTPAITVEVDGRVTVLLAPSSANVSQQTWLTFARAAPLAELSKPGSPTQHVWALLRVERDDLRVVLAYAVGVGLLSLATPIAVQALVNTVAFGTLLQPIVVLAVLLLGALSFAAVLSALQTHVIEVLQQRLFARLSLDVAYRLPRSASPVAGLNRFFDIVTVQKSLATLLTSGTEVVLQVGLGLLVLAFYHPALLALDVVLVVATTALVMLPWRRGVETAIKESKAKYAVADWLETLQRVGATHRGAAAANLAQLHTEALTAQWLVARKKHFSTVFGQLTGTLLLQVLASAGLLGVGGWLVLNQQLTLGQLVAAELIVTAVTAGISKLGKLLDATYDLLASTAKLGGLTDVALNVGGHEPLPGRGPLQISVQGAANLGVLNVPARARLAVVGPFDDDAARVLAGLMTPKTGTIQFGGIDATQLDRLELESATALVGDDAVFDGTLLENVVAGGAEVTASKARSALERVGLESTRNVEDLNRAERVLVGVARAIAKTPRLLVVDTTFDALEPAVRERVLAVLTDNEHPWTLVAFARDPNAAVVRACTQTHRLSGAAS